MIIREDFVIIDTMAVKPHRSFMEKTIGEGDATGDRIGVEILTNGEPANLTGCYCKGFFIRNGNADTIIINGTVRGNRAWVDLPGSAYAYEGTYSLVIKITHGSSEIMTVRIVDGTVINTSTEPVLDSAHALPTEAELEELIASVEDAAEVLGGMRHNMEQISGEDYRAVVVLES